MSAQKTVPITLRDTPEFKRLLVLVAQAERRSRTNLLEVVLFEHCRAKGLVGAGPAGQGDSPGSNGFERLVPLSLPE